MIITHLSFQFSRSVIVFVVRPEMTNKFDLRWMEYGIKALGYGVKVIRRTLPEIGERAELRGKDRRLFM